MCCVEELKKSPLFAISRCGIELAHSNFWKWLIDIEDDKHQHPFIEVFIPDFYNNGYSFPDVKREEWHRDLSIHYKDEQNNAYCFVVENKIKSIPTQKQLDHYKDKIESAKREKFGGGVLTGIVETLTPKNGWKFLSYKEIAARIKYINELQKVNIGNFYYETIAQYAKDLRNIYSMGTHLHYS